MYNITNKKAHFHTSACVDQSRFTMPPCLRPPHARVNMTSYRSANSGQYNAAQLFWPTL